jgi:hypothetical protein
VLWCSISFEFPTAHNIPIEEEVWAGVCWGG